MHKFIELCCIRKEDGEKFFEDRKTYELFVSSNTEELSEIYKQASFFEYGTPEDQTSNWPEVKWMKQHQEDFVKVDNKKNKKRKRVKKVG